MLVILKGNFQGEHFDIFEGILKEHILIFYGEKAPLFLQIICVISKGLTVSNVKYKFSFGLKFLFHIVNGGGPVPVEGDISVQNAFCIFIVTLPITKIALAGHLLLKLGFITLMVNARKVSYLL